MGAPKGSNNGKGVKGRSGRKSAYEEEARARMLIDSWFTGIDVQTLDNFRSEFLIKTPEGKTTINLKSRKKLKLWELYLLKTIMNPRGTELQQQFDKLLPTKIEQQGNEEKPLFAPVEILIAKN